MSHAAGRRRSTRGYPPTPFTVGAQTTGEKGKCDRRGDSASLYSGWHPTNPGET